jgi:hypothetical protein
MNRETLINIISPVWQRIRNKSEFEIRTQLQGLRDEDLETVYARLQASGHIDTHAQEIEAAKQQAREIQRQAALQEKQQLLQKEQQVLLQIGIENLFRPNAVLAGKTLVDCAANREFLGSLPHPGEEVRNPIQWLKKVLADSPSLIQQLAWGGLPLSKQELQQQERESLDYDKQVFHEFCRDTEKCAEVESNFNVARTVLGSPLGRYALDTSVVLLPDGVFLIGDDGQTHALVPMDTIQSQKFHDEKLQLDQARLKDMAHRGDIAGLRARAKADHERGGVDQQTGLYGLDRVKLEYEYSLLKTYSDRAEFNLPPLPSHYLGQEITPEWIRKQNREVLSQVISKYGTTALNFRLHRMEFPTNWSQRLRQLEEQLGYRNADFTRPDELAQALKARN